MLIAGKVILGGSAATWAPNSQPMLGQNRATWAPLYTMNQKNYEVGVPDAEAFLGGLIYGLIEKDDLPEIQKCMKNTDVVAAEVKKIVTEMSAGTLDAIIKGVQDLATLIQQMPEDLSDCENIQGDVTKIEKWAEQFVTPTGLGKIVENVMANWSSIQTDIATIQTDIQGSKYKDAGEQTADIITLAAGKIDYAKLHKEVNEAIIASSEMYLY